MHFIRIRMDFVRKCHNKYVQKGIRFNKHLSTMVRRKKKHGNDPNGKKTQILSGKEEAESMKNSKA